MTRDEIVRDITNHFAAVSFGDCYIGITSDVETGLFENHSVSKEGKWMHSPADSDAVAHDVEQHFLDAGMDGGAGGGEPGGTIVYAYMKTPTTRP